MGEIMMDRLGFEPTWPPKSLVRSLRMEPSGLGNQISHIPSFHKTQCCPLVDHVC